VCVCVHVCLCEIINSADISDNMSTSKSQMKLLFQQRETLLRQVAQSKAELAQQAAQAKTALAQQTQVFLNNLLLPFVCFSVFSKIKSNLMRIIRTFLKLMFSDRLHTKEKPNLLTMRTKWRPCLKNLRFDDMILA
jgi:hypothetical protein